MNGGRRSVTAETLVRALKRRRTAIPAEIGTFLILEACEGALARGPAELSLASIFVEESGNVVTGTAVPCDDEAAARALHNALTSLLVASGPALSPGLLRLVEQGPAMGWALAHLRDELEAALVPLNRTASRRVLARFVREADWAEPGGAQRGGGAAFRDLDGELSAFLGGGETDLALSGPSSAPPSLPAPPAWVSARPPAAGQVAPPTHEEVPIFDSGRPSRAGEESGRTVVNPEPEAARMDTFRPRRAQIGPKPLDSMGVRALAEAEARKLGGGWGVWVGILLVLLSVGLVGSVWWFRPDLAQRLVGQAEPAPSQPTKPTAVRKAPAGGDLVVRVDTERAQILRRVGNGPVVVDHLPVGVAHEFVAVFAGYAPSRVVVPSDADWERTDGGLAYEVALQLSPAERADVYGLGPSQMPREGGRAPAGLGSIRIVTTPRGATVYQLIGFAPKAEVTDLPIDAPQELLVYKEGFSPKRREVGSEDYVERDGRTVAEVTVELTKLPGAR